MLRTVAIDMGGSGSRAFEGLYDGGRLCVRELARMKNEAVQLGGAYVWDLPRLVQDAKDYLAYACAAGSAASFGIDTWGASMGMLDANGELLALPRHYRDQSYRGIAEEAFAKIGKTAFFERMGCSLEDNIALFQCYANRLYAPERFAAVRHVLMCADLIRYFLTGEMQAEETITGTGGFIDPFSRTCNEAVMQTLGIPPTLLPPIVSSGTNAGRLSADVCRELGVPPLRAMAVAGHDTASATLALPMGRRDAFLILGTWGLLGITGDQMFTDERVYAHNCVNELNPQGEIRFLRNIPGFWIYNQCAHEMRKSHEALIREAEAAKPFGALIDMENPCFFTGGNMRGRIAAYLTDTGQPIPETDGSLIRCILESMALKYRCAIEDMRADTDRDIQWLNITGGGVRNPLLLRMIAEATGCRIRVCAPDGSAVGNILMQLMGMGEIRNIEEARELAVRSFPAREIETENSAGWEEACLRYRRICIMRGRA